MPRELIAPSPSTPAFRDYDEPELGPTQIRIRTEFASPKHGTELVGYRNDPAASRPYDRELGAVKPSASGPTFPRRLGNMATGVVTDCGPVVTRFAVGDRVFGHFPIRETQTVDQQHADPIPEGMSDETVVCLDPAVMAFAMRDANIGLGDRVAVFGLGAIGLMAAQLARIDGADWVVGVDPIEARRDLALSLGVDVALDARANGGDMGLAIRELTRTMGSAPAEDSVRERVLGGYWDEPSQLTQLGVDVAVEASGASRALHQAIRATRFGGTVCLISFYGSEASGLHLGEEFHINQLQLISARAESIPLRGAPSWTLARMVETTLGWLGSGRLRTDGIIQPIVPFEEAADAYRDIDEHPERSIKLGIRFS